MLSIIRNISLFNKIFNVRGQEWTRIALAFMMRFFYRVGFVIGWTVLVGMFIARYGIASLPYLFILNAVFTIVGSFFYSVLLDRFAKKNILIATIIIASAVLFSATFFVERNIVFFFAFVIVAVSIFLMQLKLVLAEYVEKMFTALESERTFPLIEAAETIGGIIAGLAVTMLANSIDPFKFIYLWVAVLILLIPLVFIREFIDQDIPLINNERALKSESGVIDKVRLEFAGSKQGRFVFGLFVIVFFQWLIFNLLEFQYTQAVYTSVSGVVMDAGSGFEHAFIHDLGALFILFSSSALLLQLFVGSRLINYLGVVGSMLLHTVVAFFSFFGLTVSSSFYSAILAKNNFTITSIIFTNAYHSSYYAIKEKMRAQVREMLEGIVRPIGALVGTSGLILLQFIFKNEDLTLSINILLLVSSLLMLFVTYRQQHKYTHVAVDDLLNSKDKESRLNAIDILAQRGHRSSIVHLRKILHSLREPLSVRVRILQAFAELQDLDLVDDIIRCFDCKSIEMREAALNALLAYNILQKESDKNSFIKYNLITALKKLYRHETQEVLQVKIIYLMSSLSSVATTEFLLRILSDKKSSSKAEAILALANYDDPNVLKILIPYLKNNSPKIRISTAIALSNFADLRDRCHHIINSFLYSGKSENVAYGLYAIGELNWKEKQNMCFDYLNSKNKFLRMHAAVALAKMGSFKSIKVLVDLLFSSDKEDADMLKLLLKKADPFITSSVEKIIKHMVARKVEEINAQCDCLEDLKADELKNLKWCYSLVGDYEEADSINSLINRK